MLREGNMGASCGRWRVEGGKWKVASFVWQRLLAGQAALLFSGGNQSRNDFVYESEAMLDDFAVENVPALPIPTACFAGRAKRHSQKLGIVFAKPAAITFLDVGRD